MRPAVSKASRRLAAVNAKIETRSLALARPLMQWLERAVDQELSRALRGLRKQDPARDRDALRSLILRAGLAQALDSGEAAAGRGLGSRSKLVADAIAGRPVTLGAISEWIDGLDASTAELYATNKATVERIVQRVVAESRGQNLTTAEVARRIRQEAKRHADFGWERAMRIARTELGMAETAGTMRGFEVGGVKRKTWLAFTSPIWDRRHDLMNGETVDLDQSFRLPDGTKMRHPHDPAAPIRHVVHCRCSIAPG